MLKNEPVLLSNLDLSYLKIKCMLLGPQGCGKTLFSLGSQYMRTLHLDVDGYGVLSARCFQGNPVMGIPACNQNLIMTQRATNWKEMLGALDYVEKNYRNFDLLVMDTATEFQRRIISELQGTTMGSPLEIQGWGQVWGIMEQVTQRLVNLPIHVIYNVHETIKRDRSEKLDKFVPTFQGRFADVYGKHFSEIWRYTIANQYSTDQQGNSQVHTNRLIQCQIDETLNAKDRSSALDKWEFPQIDYIFGKIMSRIAGTSQVTQ